jgi:hypothetical protein
MRELSSVVLEMERQGKRLHGLLRVGRLNAMTQEEFRAMVALMDRLMGNVTDFNVLHFGPSGSRRRKSTSAASAALAKGRTGKEKERKTAEARWVKQKGKFSGDTET